MINERLRNYLANDPDYRYFPELGDDDSLIEAGVIDSFSVVKLVVFLEAEFGIRIDVTDLVADNVSTLKNIETMVTRKLAADNS